MRFKEVRERSKGKGSEGRKGDEEWKEGDEIAEFSSRSSNGYRLTIGDATATSAWRFERMLIGEILR